MTDFMYFLRPVCIFWHNIGFPKLCQDAISSQDYAKFMAYGKKKKNVIEHKYVVITKILACDVVHPQC